MTYQRRAGEPMHLVVRLGCCVWPGLPGILQDGRWGSLIWAATFSVCFNSWLLMLTVWPQLAPNSLRFALGCLTLGAWSVFLVRNLLYRPREEFDGSSRGVDLFLDARMEYLKGNLAVADAKLREVVSQHPQDVCARLMTVAALRRQGKVQEAREQLRHLQRWQSASAWQLEIRREWELLAKRQYPTPRSVGSSGDVSQPTTVPTKEAA